MLLHSQLTHFSERLASQYHTKLVSQTHLSISNCKATTVVYDTDVQSSSRRNGSVLLGAAHCDVVRANSNLQLATSKQASEQVSRHLSQHLIRLHWLDKYGVVCDYKRRLDLLVVCLVAGIVLGRKQAVAAPNHNAATFCKASCLIV